VPAMGRAALYVNARRVSHPIAHVAALETAASRQWGKAWRTYVKLYQAPPPAHSDGWRV